MAWASVVPCWKADSFVDGVVPLISELDFKICNSKPLGGIISGRGCIIISPLTRPLSQCAMRGQLV
jgi:hypothetical protein